MFFWILILVLNVAAARENRSFSRIINEKNFLLELFGKIDDCPCTIETVNQFNNAQIYPRITSIMGKDYFRFYKVNLRKECPFWKDSSQCAMRYCQVESCEEKDIPFGIKNGRRFYNTYNDLAIKYLDPHQDFECEEQQSHLSFINTTISAETMEDFALWQAYDNVQELYCYLPDDDSNAQYVDLIYNPERYTGYKGKNARRIWHVIYKENCFRPENFYDAYIESSKLKDMCIEERTFYRAISGLHASINVHLCAQYLLADQKSGMFGGRCNAGQNWGPNVEEFYVRFSLEHTNGEGLQWLNNLYFLYLLELRSLMKAADYLKREEYYTGYDKEDADTRTAINNLLEIVKKFPNHFNENILFSKGEEAAQLKEEFRRHFRNISRIMDCVGCDKCRLWGKLQTQGLGTAFKILFSGQFDELHPTGNNISLLKKRVFQLERSEIVALFNAFARLSTSIYELERFRNFLNSR